MTRASRPYYQQLYDPVWLRERYIDDGLTIEEIAHLIGCHDAPVWYALKRYEISTRRRGPGLRVVRELLPPPNSIAVKPTRHGYTGTPTYKTWEKMRARCLNPNDDHYPLYGGRGILVCQRWQESFTNFLEDMGERPAWATGGIDRIDTLGNYEPSNCRWATTKQQADNRRDRVPLEKRVEIWHSMSAGQRSIDVAKSFGVSRRTVNNVMIEFKHINPQAFV